jgi:hypothetical protein
MANTLLATHVSPWSRALAEYIGAGIHDPSSPTCNILAHIAKAVAMLRLTTSCGAVDVDYCLLAVPVSSIIHFVEGLAL